MRTRGRSLIVAALACTSTACGVIGPSCLDQQKTGDVVSLSGTAEVMSVTTHDVPYDRQGSQNDVEIGWSGQGTIGGPRLQLYATSARCDAFAAPASGSAADPNTGACAIVARCGGTLAPDARPCALAGACAVTADDLVCRSLIVTGPGNGAPADFDRYKLHVVADPAQRANYGIHITWFSGPDC